MFKMKKSASKNVNKLSQANDAIDQLASSAKDINIAPLEKVNKVVSPDKTKEAIAKFMEGVSATGKKIDKQLGDKGIDLKKESVGLALNSLGLATKYLAQKNTRKKIVKTVVKFVALMPMRPVLIATGVGVGVYVVAQKVKKAKLEKEQQKSLKSTTTENSELKDTKTANPTKSKSSEKTNDNEKASPNVKNVKAKSEAKKTENK